MVSDLSADTTASSGCSALSSADSQTVADAFGSLTAVTQQMLSTLIGKHSIFAQFGVTAPVTSSLQSLEAALDSFTFALTAVAPSQQGAITTGKDSVDTPLGKAIAVYGEICIPSPLYPSVPPVCVGL
jgi:Hydrophobic surface binding protein A